MQGWVSNTTKGRTSPSPSSQVQMRVKGDSVKQGVVCRRLFADAWARGPP